MKIVVLSPAGVFDRASLPGQHESSIELIAWSENDLARTIVLTRPTGLARRFADRVSRHIVGRILVRLTPLDPSVAFWKATRRDPRASAAVLAADLVIAPERDACFAAWKWNREARRGNRAPRSVFGFAAGRTILAEVHS